MSLRELYQEIIIDHGKTPRNFGKLPEANHQLEGHNPLCGDRLTLYLFEENGVIKAVKFEGSGCAISMASTSLMTESVIGKSLTEINRLAEQFHHLALTGDAEQADLGKLAVFSGVAEFPMRVKCATLAWHTLKSALSNQTNPVSTE